MYSNITTQLAAIGITAIDHTPTDQDILNDILVPLGPNLPLAHSVQYKE